MLEGLRRKLSEKLPDLRHDGEFWRRAASAGAAHGPELWVRYSPPIFGIAFAAALPAMRARVRENLQRAGLDGSPVEVARVFARYAGSLTDNLAIGSGRDERVSTTIDGDEHYAAARAKGHGVIVATAHTSGWYAAGPALASVYDDEVIQVMRNERDARAQEVQAETRRMTGVRALFVGDDPLAAMPLVPHLKRGGVVAIQMDRALPGQRSRQVPFFGGEHSIPEGPLSLARLTGAPIVTVLGLRTAYMKYAIEISPAVELARSAQAPEIDRAAAQIAANIESFVRKNPYDWFHFSG